MTWQVFNGWSRTDTHLYFVGGSFSQWAASPFTAEPLWGPAGVRSFATAEQWMMYHKAWLFADGITADAIMAHSSPRLNKEAGRRVIGYDDDRWCAVSREVVFVGQLHKFEPPGPLRNDLLATGNMTIVEGANYDTRWGVGIGHDDPAILDEANWRGTNWLGQAIMKAREVLR